MNNAVFPHPVFALDVQYNGYGIARIFSKLGIKVIGFFPRDACYESRSRLLHEFVYLDGSDDDYLKTLVEKAKPFEPYKPVLIVTSDLFQEFIRKNYDTLKAHFIFEIPTYDVLKGFIEKDLFKEMAVRLHVTIPFSYEINKASAATLQDSDITFPLIIKPKYRDNHWMEIYPAIKVFVAGDRAELASICNELFEVTDRLVLQEWIPGPDSNIYYCMAYIKPNGEVLSTFCGRKIHQHPILLGSTSSAEAADNPELLAEALRILKQNGNYGFCSVEFKKNNQNGKYYVIEPTVGRINQQEVTAALHGHDIVLDAYCYLTGVSMELPRPKVPNYYFIDEIMDLQSCFEYKYHNRFSWWDYFNTLRKRRLRFMYLNWRDPILSFFVLLAMVKHIAYYLVKGRARYHSNDVGTAKLFGTFSENVSTF